MGHKFIKKIQDEGTLLKVLTQNIDDLEVKAGVKPEVMIQAHGHSRSAHCISCEKEHDVEKWRKAIEKEEILKC